MDKGVNGWYLVGPVSQTWRVLLLQMPQFSPSAELVRSMDGWMIGLMDERRDE